MKLHLVLQLVGEDRSLPVRGAWIEIDFILWYASDGLVAPRKGSVD